MRSRMTCQRIEGSESSSHCMTDFLCSGVSSWRVLVVTCRSLLLLCAERVFEAKYLTSQTRATLAPFCCSLQILVGLEGRIRTMIRPCAGAVRLGWSVN